MSGKEIFEIEMCRKCVFWMGILGKENSRAKVFRRAVYLGAGEEKFTDIIPQMYFP